MRSEKLTFKNRKGLQLAATLELPAEGKAKSYAIFAHCFTCSKDLAAVRNITRALSGKGFGVLRFDFTGLGRSEGEFKDSHFTANIEDLLDAASFLEESYTLPAILIGHSLGGAACIQAASEMKDLKGLVTIGSPANPAHVKHLIDTSALKDDESVTVKIGGRPFEVDAAFVKHLEQSDGLSVLAKLRVPLLVCHSPQDLIVNIDNAGAIYKAAHHPKSFLSLDGADHLLSDAEDSLYVGNMIAAWAQRYLEKETTKALSTHEQVVVSLSAPGFTAQVLAGKHRLIADEPASIGGQDLGPAPYEFVSTGLAACTAMTIRMYTDRKEWPLDEVNVHVSHHKEEAKSEEGLSTSVDVFERKIEILGDLDEAKIKRILNIADKCPVHKSLHNSSIIRTQVIE